MKGKLLAILLENNDLQLKDLEEIMVNIQKGKKDEVE